MKKLKIYFLTNIFTNTHYAFVPNILDDNINKLLPEFAYLSSVNKTKVIDAIKYQEENIDLGNISLIKDHTKIVPINIELYKDLEHGWEQNEIRALLRTAPLLITCGEQSY